MELAEKAESMRKAWWSIGLAAVTMLIWSGPGRAQAELTKALSHLPSLVGQPATYQRNGTESIFGIARRYGVGAAMISNANAGSLTGGGELLTLPTQHIAPLAHANGIVINLPERNLYFYRDGRPYKVFPIAIGRRGWETPTGEFHIANMRKNPTWFPPKWAIEEHPVPPGPDNPLGDRWMGLSLPGYGLHATNSPASIGRFASHGCMRMYPEHAHELYELVKVGTPVRIIYQVFSIGYDPEEGIVYLAHHPDPYQQGDATVERVEAELASYGLAEFADVDAIAKALERPRGVPVPVVGSTTKVIVGGREARFALAPIATGSDWLVPAGGLAQALGAHAEIGPGGGFALLARNGQRVVYTRDSSEALVNGALVNLETPMRTALGYPLVPLKATATALGASVGWDEGAKAVLIWTSPTPGVTRSAQVGGAIPALGH